MQTKKRSGESHKPSETATRSFNQNGRTTRGETVGSVSVQAGNQIPPTQAKSFASYSVKR
ncbi:MAG: hypothetical protein FWD49_05565 [Firmicutes bacterium]|nr:hypothetical protein [Bacillota bacterium]